MSQTRSDRLKVAEVLASDLQDSLRAVRVRGPEAIYDWGVREDLTERQQLEVLIAQFISVVFDLAEDGTVFINNINEAAERIVQQ